MPIYQDINIVQLEVTSVPVGIALSTTEIQVRIN
jgi:hypothetical protein